MPLGRLSTRIDDGNETHHLWLNNGTWWVHFTLHYGFRRRRIRRSLQTRTLDEAIRRRDELLARIAREGEPIQPRPRYQPASNTPAASSSLTSRASNWPS